MTKEKMANMQQLNKTQNRELSALHLMQKQMQQEIDTCNNPSDREKRLDKRASQYRKRKVF